MSEVSLITLSKSNTRFWPMGYGTTMSAFVAEGEIKGLVMRALPDNLVGLPTQIGQEISEDIVAQIPPEAPTLFLQFASRESVQQLIKTAERLRDNWKD